MVRIAIETQRNFVKKVGETMLELKNVFYTYSKGKKRNLILHQINLSFKPGVLYVIYGASGAGKTTLLSLLGGLDKPVEGSISLDGKEYKEIGYSELRKHHVSYIFQDYHLFPYMTPLENVELAMSISKIHAHTNDAVALLHSLDLDDETIHRPVNQISGGQQQRTAIARALSCQPSYLLADEPTGNLDRENTRRIMEILTEIAHKQNKCVIVVTHSDYVQSCADVQLELADKSLKEVRLE